MATFGDTTIYGVALTVLLPLENFMGLFTTPADCNVIQSIHMYGTAQTGQAAMEAVVYRDVAGAPGPLVGTGTPGGSPVFSGPNAWWVDAILCPVIPSALYWFGFVNADPANGIAMSNGGSPGRFIFYHGADPAYPPPSNPEPGMGLIDPNQHGLYVTYFPSAGLTGRKDNNLKRLKLMHNGGL